MRIPRLAAMRSVARALRIGVPAPPDAVVPIEPTALREAWLLPGDPVRTTAVLVILSGERDNDVGPAGLAHYTEHLVWHAMAATRTDSGRTSNALTGSTATLYIEEGTLSQLARMLLTLRGVFDPIGLPDAFMAQERGVILRELESLNERRPELELHRELARLQHGDRWPAHDVIGTRASLSKLVPEDARVWHRRTHRVDNGVLVVQGRQDPVALERCVRETFGARDVAARRGSPPDPADVQSAVMRYEPRAPGTAEVHRVVRGGVAPTLLHSRLMHLPRDLGHGASRRQFDLLQALLVADGSGVLTNALRHETPLARRITMELSRIDEQYVEVVIGALPERGVSSDVVLARIDRALSDLERAGVSDDALERARRRVAARRANAPSDGLLLGDALDAVAHRAPPESARTAADHLESADTGSIDALVRCLVRADRVANLTAFPDG